MKGFHTKGYLFFRDKIGSVTIGSSNLTGNALAVNKEWNTCYSVEEDESLCRSVVEDFNELWNSPNTIKVTEEFLESYNLLYQQQKQINAKIQRARIEEQKGQVLQDSLFRKYILYGQGRLQEP